MTKLDEMWIELAKYQDKADRDGHGESWAEMCKLKSAESAFAASGCVHAKAAAYAKTTYLAADVAANVAANAAYAAGVASVAKAADRADYWAQKAIDCINKATGETE
jgi:hypothetical protein